MRFTGLASGSKLKSCSLSGDINFTSALFPIFETCADETEGGERKLTKANWQNGFCWSTPRPDERDTFVSLKEISVGCL